MSEETVFNRWDQYQGNRDPFRTGEIKTPHHALNELGKSQKVGQPDQASSASRERHHSASGEEITSLYTSRVLSATARQASFVSTRSIAFETSFRASGRLLATVINTSARSFELPASKKPAAPLSRTKS